MANSLITVTGLSLIAAVGGFIANIAWTAPDGLGCLPYMQPAKFEVYTSASNSFGSATKAGETPVGIYNQGSLGAGVLRYVWVRAIDPAGNPGPVYPAGAGQPVITLTTLPPANSVGSNELQDGAVSGQKVAAGAISADKIQAGAITADKIAAGVITSDKIAAGAVTADKMQVSSLSAISANLGSIVVQSANIANLSVSNLKLAGEAVSTDKVQNNAISDVAFSGPGIGQGDLATCYLNVTNGYALVMGAFILDIPASNSSNVGYINIGLKRDGFVIAQRTVFYDDNFAGGYPVFHADGAGPGIHSYTVFAQNLSGAGQWNMSGAVTVINFRK